MRRCFESVKVPPGEIHISDIVYMHPIKQNMPLLNSRAANDTFLIRAPGTRRFIPTHLTLLRLCVSLNLQFIQHINAKHC